MAEGNEREAFKDRQNLFSAAVDRITEALEAPDAAKKLLEQPGRTRLADLLSFARKQADIYDSSMDGRETFDAMKQICSLPSPEKKVEKKRAEKKATRKSTRSSTRKK